MAGPLAWAVPAADAVASVSYTVSENLTVGLERLWPLAALPVVAALLAVLVLREGGDRSASTRSRRLLFASRVLVAALLVVGAAGPYTVQDRETPGEPRVTMLTDESASMGVYPNATGELVADVEDAGVPVSSATIAAGRESRVGDGIVANLRENGTVVVVSDGQVTDGRSIAGATETARNLNATVSVVDLSADEGETAVSVVGPETATVGLETTFSISLESVGTDERVPVSVTVDGEVVRNDTIDPDGGFTITETFEEEGPHRVTARIESDDVYDRNDVFYRTVRVVEKPDVLYVGGRYPLREYLDSLYNVTERETVPSDLEDYSAVVLQDRSAGSVGNTSALQDHVVDGGGLVVVGGDDAYESGGYEESPLAPMLPVRIGNATGGTANIVLLVDISGSAAEGLSTQKAVALDVLSQLDDQNRVGVVAFNNKAYRVANLQGLSSNREVIADRIRRLATGRGGTHIDIGLQGSRDLLGERDGTVILLSDGIDDADRAAVAASQLGERGIRVITVGTGDNVKEETLRRVASESDGTYFSSEETERLRLLFGGGSREYEGENLTVVTRNTFITSGLSLTASPGQANKVAVKSGADYQVATSDGTPAVTSWRFGLGRVVAVTAYDDGGGLGPVLEEPDSLLVTRSVNYAVGDPRERLTGVTSVENVRVGRTATLTYRGETRPSAPGVSFRRVSEDRFRGEFTAEEAGYSDVLDTEYAVNYPREYAQFGPNPRLSGMVAATDGQVFTADEGEAIARLARDQATRVRTVRDRWAWLAIALGLLLFVAEVVARRVQVYRGRTSLESGLP